jgi:hypothetical protein
MRLARDSGGGSLADYERALPETKAGVCVSTVSIVCSRDGLPDRAPEPDRWLSSTDGTGCSWR